MSSASSKTPIVILGAGVGGLAAGWFLARTGRYDVTLLERAPVIGGHCGSFQHNGFTLDYGPHKMYSVIPGILDELRDLMRGRLLTHQKRNSVYLRGHRLAYPLQMGNLANVLGMREMLRLGSSYAAALAKNSVMGRKPGSYADYVIQRFGRATYRLVFEPLAWKVWGDPATLHPEMARTRIPSSGGSELLLKLLRLKKESTATNAETFYYPEKGFGDFPRALEEQIERHGGRILVNARIDRLVMEGNRISAVLFQAGGSEQRLPCHTLISSLPLTNLGELIYGDREPEFHQAAQNLRFRHLVLVYLFLNRPAVLEDHWVFFPERELLFSRVFEQKRMNPKLGPPDRTALCCDFTCAEDDSAWRSTDQELASRCIEGLVRTGFIKNSEVEDCLVKRSKNFYPIYDLAYAEKMRTVSRTLRRIPNLLTTGRIGMYNYNNSDHCLDMGRFIAEGLLNGDSPPQIWEGLEKRVGTYRIVD